MIEILLIVFNFGWCLVDTGRGTLYTSDATGIIFSESLKNHLYPNYEDLTDFYRVQSMRGVYIASQLMKDDSIRTVISFDRGSEWQPIKRPDGAPCKDETKVFNCTLCCQLIIHTLPTFTICITVYWAPLTISALHIIQQHISHLLYAVSVMVRLFH